MITQVQQGQPERSLRARCGVAQASRSWSYAAPAAHDQRVQRDVARRAAIEAVVLAFPGYGYRRVTCALQRAGWVVTRTRVLRVMRVMRQEALLCHLPRHFVVTTTEKPSDATPGYRTYPNLLRATPLLDPLAPLDPLDQAWVADITAIRLPTCGVYLACLLDADSTPTRAGWWAGSARAPWRPR